MSQAMYNLALLYLDGRVRSGHEPRGRTLAQSPPMPAAPEAQYALATLYKEGSGVAKDPARRGELLAAAARSGNVPPRSNMRSRCSTAPACRRTRAARPPCSARSRTRAMRSRRTGSRAFWPTGTACRPIRWRGHQMAHHRQGGRRLRRVAGKFADMPIKDSARRAGRRERRTALACSPHAQPALVATPVAFARPGRYQRVRPLTPSGRVSAPMRGAWSLSCPCPFRPAQRHDQGRAPAGRSLSAISARVENLQVSLKGPANFVSRADIAPRKSSTTDLFKARPGYGFIGEEGGSARAPTSRTPGSSIRSTAPPTSCTAFPLFAISIALQREDTHRRRRDLQSRQ